MHNRVFYHLRTLANAAGLLVRYPRMLFLPLLATLTIYLAAGVMTGAAAVDPIAYSPLLYVAMLLALAILISGLALSSAASIDATADALTGGDPSIRKSLRVAWRQRGQVLAWAVFAALVRGGIEEIGDLIPGPLDDMAMDLAWRSLSFFVLPLIIIENMTPKNALGKSARLASGGLRNTRFSPWTFWVVVGLLLGVPVLLGGLGLMFLSAQVSDRVLLGIGAAVVPLIGLYFHVVAATRAAATLMVVEAE